MEKQLDVQNTEESGMKTKKPTEEIEKLRQLSTSGKINASSLYKIDIGDGKIMSFTGAELLETAKAYVDLADAEIQKDKAAMAEAFNRIYTP